MSKQLMRTLVAKKISELQKAACISIVESKNYPEQEYWNGVHMALTEIKLYIDNILAIQCKDYASYISSKQFYDFIEECVTESNYCLSAIRELKEAGE